MKRVIVRIGDIANATGYTNQAIRKQAIKLGLIISSGQLGGPHHVFLKEDVKALLVGWSFKPSIIDAVVNQLFGEETK